MMKKYLSMLLAGVAALATVATAQAGAIDDAVKRGTLRVGMDPIKVMAMALLLDQLRQTQRQAACRDIANRLWERCVHVAALAFVLARKLTRLDADAFGRICDRFGLGTFAGAMTALAAERLGTPLVKAPQGFALTVGRQKLVAQLRR
mgnify:CR=1 FL=1